jgi:hypothetical protein
VFLVITGLAQESRIAAGPGVSHIVCSGSDPTRLRQHLSRLDASGLRAASIRRCARATWWSRPP